MTAQSSLKGFAIQRLKEIEKAGQTVGREVGQAEKEGGTKQPVENVCVGQDTTRETANNEVCPAVPPPSAWDSGTSPETMMQSGTSSGTESGTALELPFKIREGLNLLSVKPLPCFRDKSGAAAWPQIVADALALARPDPVAGYSIAARAMLLGWDAKDLFGFWPGWQTWDDWVSLSVWAQSRKILVIGERTACLSSTEKTKAHYDRLNGRPASDVLKYLWELH